MNQITYIAKPPTAEVIEKPGEKRERLYCHVMKNSNLTFYMARTLKKISNRHKKWNIRYWFILTSLHSLHPLNMMMIMYFR